MRLVKTILGACALAALIALATPQNPTPPAAAGRPRPAATQIPAQADLAEAVYAMVVQNARDAGLSQPVTLCQACVAAHLGLPEDVLRERCQRACGLP